MNGCSKAIQYISFLNKTNVVSDKRKQSLNDWEDAFHQLETQARQFLASGLNLVALERLLQQSHALNYEFNRFLQTHHIYESVENDRQHFDPKQMYDHTGNKVKHGRETVNGVRLHYVTAGSNDPLLLLHGARCF